MVHHLNGILQRISFERSFVTVIGVSNDKVLVAGTQYDANYQQLRDNGKELDVSTLYDKYNNSDYEEIAKQIVFAGSQRC